MWLFVALLVDIIKTRQLPARACLFKVINDHVISGGVRTRDGEMFRIRFVQLRLFLVETSNSVSLFAEQLAIAPRELCFSLDAWNTVRHLDRKLRKTRHSFNVVFADRGFECLPEVNG